MAISEGDRVTPLGLWRYAKEFYEAGVAARQLYPNRVFVPSYYLMGHSIELSFKAFLRGRGCTIEELKGWGHNLETLFKRAREHQLGREVVLTQVEGGVVHLLNTEYMSKRFEYIRSGSMSIPEWHLLQGCAGRLVRGLREFCERKTIR